MNKLGFAMTRSHNWLSICFNPTGPGGHIDGDRNQMDQFLLAFKRFIDATVHLPTLSTDLSAGSDSSSESKDGAEAASPA